MRDYGSSHGRKYAYGGIPCNPGRSCWYIVRTKAETRVNSSGKYSSSPKKRSWPREANCGRVARRSPPTGWDARRKNNRTKRRKARASSTLRSTFQRNSSASAGRGKMMLPVARRATAPSGRGPERRFFTSSREADASWTRPYRGCAMRNAERGVQNGGGTCEFGGRRDDKKTGRRAIGP